MANRITNFNDIPVSVPEDAGTKAQRVTDIPDRFQLVGESQQLMDVINRLTLNLKAVKQDLRTLGLLAILTPDDLRGLVTLSSSELVELNNLLGVGIVSSLASLTSRVGALESRVADLEAP